MSRFEDFDYSEDRVTGMVNQTNIGDIAVGFDLEDHNGTDDLNGLMDQAESWLQALIERCFRI